MTKRGYQLSEQDDKFGHEEFDDEIEDEEIDDSDLNDEADEDDDDVNDKVNEDKDEGNGSSVKKKRKKELEAPTAEELNNLRETEALFHSSLFRLQLNELLTEVRLKDKCHSHIANWFKKFDSYVCSLKGGFIKEISDDSWVKIKVPLIQKPHEIKGNFEFQPPKSIKIIGNYALKTAIRRETIVDIAIEMPAQLWHEQDYLNHKYHYKRALYLVFIAQSLQKQEFISELSFTYSNGNHIKPILIIIPTGKVGKYCSFAIHLHPPLIDPKNDDVNLSKKSFFRLSRYSPDIINIRSAQSKYHKDEMNTSFYNSSIIHDLTLMSNFEFASKTINEATNIQDAIILLDVWLKQRNLKMQFGNLMSLYVCYLIKNHKFSRHSSCYQIFRNTLLAISQSKWDSEGISLCQDNNSLTTISNHLTYSPVVFLDSTGFHNLFWEITSDLYERIKHEAKLTISQLDSSEINSFEFAFMRPIEFQCKFDSVLNISLNAFMKSPLKKQLQNQVLNRSGDIAAAFSQYLIKLLKRSLGPRIVLIQQELINWLNKRWLIDHEAADPNKQQAITFGILLNPENAFSSIDKGPAADGPEAKEFREFWGDKSELRRFQDGFVCEAVYWPAKTAAEKRQIIVQSIEFILHKFAKLNASDFRVTLTQLDSFLQLKNVKFIEKDFRYGTGEEAAFRISQSYETISKRLRNIDGLALAITGVQGISPAFRTTEVFPPLGLNNDEGLTKEGCMIFNLNKHQKAPTYFKPLEIIVHFEGSGKWPDDIGALKRVKAAFYIELSKKIKSQYNVIAIPTVNHVDIYQDGFIFRVTVASTKEITLLRQVQTDGGLIKKIENDKANYLERKTEILPKISSALNGLSHQNVSFNVVCRLVKRWLAAQLLFHYFDEIAIELLVASIYLNCGQYTVPNSSFTGFLRFLNLICDFNWKMNPLIVNLNNEMKSEQIGDIQSKFTSLRPTLPPMFIATPYDTQLSMWTRHSPNALILNRLIQIAKAAREYLFAQTFSLEQNTLQTLFHPPTDIYDVLIRVKKDQIVNIHQSVDGPKSQQTILPFNHDKNKSLPIVDFNPIEIYLKKLRQSYDDFALFFYDPFGGSEIGVLLKPKVFEQQQFKLSHINGCMIAPTTKQKNEKAEIVTNIQAILEDFAILGNGIVDLVKAKSEKWAKRLP